MPLVTKRLQLRLQTPAEVLAWLDSLPAADRAEVSPLWVERVRTTPIGDYWSLSWIITESDTGHNVGSCSFKGPPDVSATVEVAYFIEPTHRLRGYATETLDALTEFALMTGQVQRVIAHTKSDNPASERVLTKCGYDRLGEVIDPEDGPVQRWQKLR